MATKRHRRGKWEYRIRNAALLPRPLHFTFDDEQEGDTYVRRIEQLLERGIVPDEYRKPVSERHALLRDDMSAYRDVQAVSLADQGYLDVLRDRLPPKLELRAVTFEWAQGWVTSLKRDRNLSPSTIQHHVGALARCLDWVVAQGRMPLNPLRQLRKGYATYTVEDVAAVKAIEGVAKVREERERRLLDGEDAKIRAVMAGGKPEGRQRPLELHHQAMLVLMYDLALESAMRMSEMYTLDIRQLDFVKRTIFLDKTKNGSKRQVPMSSVAHALLQAAVDRRKSGQLFPWWSGERTPEEMKRCTSQLSRQYSRIFDAAGCVDLNFHDLRHEATSRLFERTTLSDLQIAKITGHKDIRVLARYANLRGSDLAGRMW